MEYIIGIDLGGTQIRAVLADTSGRILNRVQALTEAHQGPQSVIERVLQAVEQMQAMLPPGGSVRGIGVGAPGPLDPVSGVLFSAPNMPGWHHVPLRDILAERTGLRVALSNDANAAVLAEWYFGGGIGYRHLVYITISTGIGSGIIVDGRLLLGRLGSGGELGHAMLDDGSGLLRSWEQVASGTAMRAAAVEWMARDPDTLLHRLATPQTVTSADVAMAAARGDGLCQQLMDREGDLLGLGFVNALHLYSPEIILVGGSVVTANPSLLERARAVVQERVISDIYRSVPIEVARLGGDVGLFGAVSLLLEPGEHSTEWKEVAG
jgi:glucokinase